MEPNLILTSETIAAFTRGPSWQFGAHARASQHRLLWINRGGGRATIDGVVTGFGTHAALFLPAGTIHALEFTPTTSGWLLTCDADAMSDWVFPDRPLSATVPDRAKQAALITLCEDIQREGVEKHAEHSIALRCLGGLLSVWITRHLATAVQRDIPTGRSTELLQSFLKLIEDRYTAQDSVADYAAALAITPTHLTRICRDLAGKSASQMIQDRTLLEARIRLTQSTSPIKSIAEALGFTSSAYFTRLFTQKTGVSPGAFRRQTRPQAAQRAHTP